jgi:hypothetical protein
VVTVADQTVWPEGVIARYLTVGGATIELTSRLNTFSPPEPFATLAICTGCQASEEVSHWFSSGAHFNDTYEEERDEERANKNACKWAQSHAEQCRAMPKPGGE